MEMTGFLILTGTMIALGLAFVLLPLTRQRKTDGGMPHFQSNVLIHRDQLRQLQTHRDNRTLTADQIESQQTEIGKRVLEDALATHNDSAPVSTN
jgi:cytochrome c-type biogenesis protein CcmI